MLLPYTLAVTIFSEDVRNLLSNVLFLLLALVCVVLLELKKFYYVKLKLVGLLNEPCTSHKPCLPRRDIRVGPRKKEHEMTFLRSCLHNYGLC